MEETKNQRGDLIFFPLQMDSFKYWMFRLTNTFYQTGSLQTFDLVCELFSYSDEKIDTGIEEIDDIEVQQSFVRTFELKSGPICQVLSKLVRLSQVVHLEKQEKLNDLTTRYLYLINMTGVFTVGEILTGGTSLLTGTYETKQTTDETSETLSCTN